MNQRLKIFVLGIVCLFSLSLLANAVFNYSGELFFVRELEKEPSFFFLANMAENYEKDTDKCLVQAESAISVFVSKNNNSQVLYQKNANKRMAIASIAKLMTGVIASEFYPADYEIKISQAAVNQEGTSGFLSVGEVILVKDLLKMMLIESSNDAAFAIAEPMDVEGLIALMNLKAEKLGMNNTYFFNPNGLEPDDKNSDEINYSTAEDLAKLGQYILSNQTLLDITSQEEVPYYSPNGSLHHTLINTNELLGEEERIIGGKTGYTQTAGGCLLTLVKGNRDNTYHINIVLNSVDRFRDMQELIKCAN